MIRKILLLLSFMLLLALLATALYEINKNDVSIQKNTVCNLKNDDPIYLITYADGEVYKANQRALAESALNKCIDVIYMYNKEHLDKEFALKNKNILDAKRGAGYWLWKPYFVLKALQEIPENAVIVYLDSGIKIVKPLDNFINAIGDSDMLLVDNPPCLNKTYVKRDLFRIMDMDNDVTRDSEQLSAGMFVMKNTARTRKFVEKWLELAQNELAITDSPSKDEYPEFKDHRHDQSILSLLYLKNPEGIKIYHIRDLLEDVWLHRRGNISTSLFMLDYTAHDWPTISQYLSRLPFMEKVLYNILKLYNSFRLQFAKQ